MLEQQGGALGDRGCFGSEKCTLCGKSIPQMYPDTWYCMSCETRVRRKLVLDKIDFGQDVGWQFRQDLAEFLAYDVRRRQQLHYLRCSLLAMGSPFRKFIFLFGYWGGAISDTEDVIDRILGFLPTVPSRARSRPSRARSRPSRARSRSRSRSRPNRARSTTTRKMKIGWHV